MVRRSVRYMANPRVYIRHPYMLPVSKFGPAPLGVFHRRYNFSALWPSRNTFRLSSKAVV
jgi:hypothetical protein